MRQAAAVSPGSQADKLTMSDKLINALAEDASRELEAPAHHPPSVREGGREKLTQLDRLVLMLAAAIATPPHNAREGDFFGADLRWFDQAISGKRNERFTQNDLMPWELEGLREMARAKAQKTGMPFGSIGYNDFNKKADNVKAAMGGHRYQAFDDGSTLNYEGSVSGYTPMMANLLIPPYRMKMVGGGGYKFRNERDIELGTRDPAIRGDYTITPDEYQSIGSQIGRMVLPWSGAIPVSIATSALHDALPEPPKRSILANILANKDE